MVTKIGDFHGALLLLILFFPAVFLHASGQKDETDRKAPGISHKPPADVTGTWSGSFQSDTDSSSFTMTVTVTRDPQGNLTGAASLNSNCFKDSQLEVTVDGKKVVLAGSDREGNSLTLRGTLDQTGTILKLHYIANGGASGRCESERGSGNLVKN